MKYEALEPLNPSEAVTRLDSDDIDVVRRTIAVLTEVNDDDWVLATLLRYLEHSDFWVAGNAVVGLGELGRLGRCKDVEELQSRLVDVSQRRPELSARVESALSDVRMALKEKK